MLDLLLIVAVASSIWVYFDAKAIGARAGLLTGVANMGPVGWAAATLLLWIVAFPMYIAMRPTIRKEARANPPRRSMLR